MILNCVSACNRTYYGEVGYSYRLNVKKSSKERPFLCHLSFTASGQEHGDFVEVSFPTLYVYTRLKYNKDFNSFEQKKPCTSYHPLLFVPAFFTLIRYYNAFRVVWRDLDSSGCSKILFLNILFFCIYLKKWFVWIKNNLKFMKFCHNRFILSSVSKKLKFLKRFFICTVN